MKRMSCLTLATWALACGAVGNGAEPGYLAGGPVQITPQLVTELRYDDNVYRTSVSTSSLADISSSVIMIAPSIDFRILKSLNEYGLTLEANKTNFIDESDASYTDFGLLGDINLEMTTRHRVSGKFKYGSYNDESATRSLADKQPPEHILKQIDVIYGFGSLQAPAHIDVFGNYLNKSYDESQFRDQTTSEYGITGYYRLMPKTSMLLEVKKRILNYRQEQDSGYDITSYLLGLEWEATAKTIGFAKLGRRYRKSDISGISQEGYTGWELGLSYAPLSYSVIQLSTQRDYGLESDNPLTADFTKGTTTLLSWEHEWSERWKTSISTSLTRENIVTSSGVTTTHRDVEQYGFSVEYAFRRWMAVSLGYRYTNRDETAKVVTIIEDDYKRNLYLLTFKLTL